VSSLATGTLTLSVTVSTAAGGAGAAKTATATPTFTGVLDGLPSGAATYSTRRMRSAHVGPLMRVRRSSDGMEQDIGATIAGGIDTTALSAFCGLGSCFLRTWYDQSGNVRDAVQVTAARQPRIVNAGAIDGFNGIPAPYFDGAMTALATSLNWPASTSIWSTHLLSVLSNGQFLGRVWALGDGPSMGGYFTRGDEFYGASGMLGPGSMLSPRVVSIAVASSSLSSIWTNGALDRTTTAVTYGGGNPLVIGNNASNLRAFNGHVHTIYMGTTSYSTQDRQAVERWLGALSGVSVP
jgi:hypothetical protein